MAGPVGHIFTALMMLQSGNLVVQDTPAFIAGNCFPDIRYLGVIERNKTHEKNASWEQVVNEPDPFKAGMLMHALLDVAREEYMVAHHAYDYLPDIKFKAHILKLIEDIVLYDYVYMYESWPTILSYFDTLYPQEQAFGIADDDIKKWHTIIQTYCRQKPNAVTISMLFPYMLGNNWITVSIIDAATRNFSMIPLLIIENLKNNKELIKIILEFYLNAPEFMMQY